MFYNRLETLISNTIARKLLKCLHIVAQVSNSQSNRCWDDNDDDLVLILVPIFCFFYFCLNITFVCPYIYTHYTHLLLLFILIMLLLLNWQVICVRYCRWWGCWWSFLIQWMGRAVFLQFISFAFCCCFVFYLFMDYYGLLWFGSKRKQI